jgi:hypothetical protein
MNLRTKKKQTLLLFLRVAIPALQIRQLDFYKI